MDILIKSAHIIDPVSPYNETVKDILIKNGIIKKIADKIDEPNINVFDASGKFVSTGWFDLCADFCDPGYEFKEDIGSGINAAIAGGYTSVAITPSTLPVIQSKAQIEYVLNKSAGSLADVYPFGSITNDCDGKDIAELYDMKQAGAVAFSDSKKAIQDSGLLLRILQYAKSIDTKLILFSEDKSITGSSIVNESANATLSGFKGQPSIAEDIMVQRNIALCEYAGVPVHLSCISTKRSVELIREAKLKGIKVTCDVAAYNLLLDDSVLNSFDSNYKVKPFLRSRNDVEGLIEGILDGTIDAVCSNHKPQDDESKKVEFDYASFGITSLEVTFGILKTVLGKITDIGKIIQLITQNPRTILSLNPVSVAENQNACITIFDKDLKWKYDLLKTKSKSSNSPFHDVTFTGKAIAVINKNQFAAC